MAEVVELQVWFLVELRLFQLPGEVVAVEVTVIMAFQAVLVVEQVLIPPR
jgi:hypothetical protein